MATTFLQQHVKCKMNFTGNGTDYYASYAFPDKATIPAGTTEFLLKIKIVDDKILENNELFRIVAVPPDIPDGHIRCTADVIIRDDGKLLHKSYMS